MNNKERNNNHLGRKWDYWESLLTAKAMGDITAGEERYLNEHLTECERCSLELSRIEAFLAKLPDTSDELTDTSKANMLSRIKGSVADHKQSSPFWDKLFTFIGGPGLKTSYALASVILVLVIFGFYNGVNNAAAYNLRVIGGNEFQAGAPASVRILVTDSDGADPSPVKRVPIEIGLQDESGIRTTLFEGRTDEFGTVEAKFMIPDDAIGDYRIFIDAPHTNQGDPLSFGITTGRPSSILITTDKPLYKPNQTVHIKGLMRDIISGKGLSGRNLTIEIENPDGTKIARKKLETSDWGIISTNLALSDLADTGKYKIRAIADEETAEIDFKVDKYVLPKFKITIKPGKNYYLPGDELSGTITAAYHFGKPVSNGDITIKFSTFDVGPNQLHRIDAKLDEDGEYEFDYRLPNFFAGSAFLEGGTELYIDVEVRDTGGQKFSSTKGVSVYPEKLMLRAVPAGGRLVNKAVNPVYILAYRPDHTPVELKNVSAHFDGNLYEARDMTAGIYRVDIAVNRDDPDSFSITPDMIYVNGTDPEEGEFSRRSLEMNVVPEGILLLTDATFYKPGDAIQCDISAPLYVKTIFIDLFDEGRTVLTKSVSMENGKAEVTLAPPAGASGQMEVRAYAIKRNPVDDRGEGSAELWIRDVRVIFLDENEAGGEIETSFDSDEYLPGGQGNLNIRLTDSDGDPVQGAVGLKMVDEALYTLAGEEENLDGLYRELVKDILEPEFQIKGEEFLRHFNGLIQPVVADNLGGERAIGARAIGAVIAAELRPVDMDFAVDTNNAASIFGITEYEKEKAFTDFQIVLFIITGVLLILYFIANIAVWRKPWYAPLPNEERTFTGTVKTAFWPFIFFGLLPPVYFISSGAVLYNLLKPEMRYATNKPFAFKFGTLSLLYLAVGVLGITFFTGGFEYWVITWLLGSLFVVFTLFANKILRFESARWGVFALQSLGVASLGLIVLAVLSLPKLFNTDGDWASRSAVSMKGMAGADMAPADDDGGDWEAWDEESTEFDSNTGAIAGGGMMLMRGADDMMVGEMAPAAPMAEMERDFKDETPDKSGQLGLYGYASGDGGAIPPQPRLRKRFPETMLWVPELITGKDGRVQYPIDFADSITDWRLDADAITATGSYLTHEMGIIVFQPLFVDMDLPVELTRGDFIELPVVVYNFLDTEQYVRVELKPDDGFVLENAEYDQYVNLGPGDVGSVHYPIKALEAGTIKLEVGAYGSTAADRVMRELTIIPEGIKIEDSLQGRLEKGENTFEFEIPEWAVEDSEVALFKLHPGVMSQIVEGLENIFRKPFGCFEQTSSVTYPNILALKYMKDTKQIRPEIEATALTHIETGYQRLLSYEVDGGGFDWFGSPPANVILSAYGLMEFKDMSDVAYVDETVLKRTYEWLTTKQGQDGSFILEGGIHEGITSYGSSRGKATAFVAWAFRHAGFGDTDAYRKAIGAIETHSKGLDDNYIRALILNAVGDNDTYAGLAKQIADDLATDAKIDADGLVHWETDADTAVYSYGDSASIETTAIAILGLIETGLHTDLVEGAVNWLISQKSPDGTWMTTSGTVMSLKAIIAAESAGGRKITGNVEIILNGQKLDTIVLTEDNNDLLHIVDLRPALKKGKNSITVASDNAGLTYQLSYWYNEFAEFASDGDFFGQPSFEVQVDYDRTELESGGKVRTNVRVINRQSRDAMMVLVDLGLAPGFAPDAYSLDDLVEAGQIMRWERKGNQITIYLEKVRPNSTFEFVFYLTSSFPIRAQSGEVKAYRYYEPDDASVKPGVNFTVA